ncbi:carbon storage regulator [Myxococcota bacterium]|jgi:carbon storage regulator|nr:carbon storage regulator [Myxococcota bacterium]MBU1413761.1 carbon storage regulator [Myxococcota bacterium]MBU1510747.1 carbon storage regulator [Myxococcota bacterium]PKN25001.1 MAG: hypothetical protein CVU65_10050 [Deltaproteobacteria bacterium HGW-Deltaproteobacteria-22]
MLTLTRKPGQEIIVGDNIRIIVKEVRGHQVRIGICAPAGVTINRGEVMPDAEAASPGILPGISVPQLPGLPLTPIARRRIVDAVSQPDVLAAGPPRLSRSTRRPPQLV